MDLTKATIESLLRDYTEAASRHGKESGWRKGALRFP